jgi:hypothetical protein
VEKTVDRSFQFCGESSTFPLANPERILLRQLNHYFSYRSSLMAAVAGGEPRNEENPHLRQAFHNLPLMGDDCVTLKMDQ